MTPEYICVSLEMAKKPHKMVFTNGLFTNNMHIEFRQVRDCERCGRWQERYEHEKERFWREVGKMIKENAEPKRYENRLYL